MELFEAITNDVCKTRSFVLETLNHILHTIDAYGVTGVSLCFNGGKDCTVLLHLLAAAYASKGMDLCNIPVVYFKVDEDFEEIHTFNQDMIAMYGFSLTVYDDRDMKKCLQMMLDDYPSVQAIFMGQRRRDPGGSYISRITKSDPSWPQVDRVNSILDWTYSQVWTFLIAYNLPYCKLYELGYTSLGTKSLTTPNPLLKKQWAKSYFMETYFPQDYYNSLTEIHTNHSSMSESTNLTAKDQDQDQNQNQNQNQDQTTTHQKIFCRIISKLLNRPELDVFSVIANLFSLQTPAQIWNALGLDELIDEDSLKFLYKYYLELPMLEGECDNQNVFIQKEYEELRKSCNEDLKCSSQCIQPHPEDELPSGDAKTEGDIHKSHVIQTKDFHSSLSCHGEGNATFTSEHSPIAILNIACKPKFDSKKYFLKHPHLEKYNQNAFTHGIVTIQDKRINLHFWPYYPGYLLSDECLERDGRLPKIKLPRD